MKAVVRMISGAPPVRAADGSEFDPAAESKRGGAVRGDPSAVATARFRRMQLRMLVTTIVGYTLFYFLRKNLSLAMPGLAQDYGIAGGRGPRVCLFMTLGAGLCIAVFWFLPAALPAWHYMVPLAGAGFFIYGPQGLTGATAINLATNRYAGTVIGLTSLFSYGSVLFSGWGMGFLAEKTGGWGAPFACVLGAAALGCILFGLLWNTKPNGYGKD